MPLAKNVAALACSRLQRGPIRNRNPASPVVNRSLCLEGLCNKRDRCPSDSQHRRNPFLRHLQRVCLHLQTALKNPATKSLVRRMNSVAGCQLLRLEKNPVPAKLDQVIDFSGFAGSREQLCTGYPNKLAANLHDTPGEQVGLVAIKGSSGSGFSGDAPNPDAFPTAHCKDNRYQPRNRKIDIGGWPFVIP